MVLSKYESNTVYQLQLKTAMDLKPDPSKGLLYAIGQINGRSDLLLKMIDQIENYGTFAANDRVIFLGNYIAETGDNERVLDIIRSYQRVRPQQVIILRGEKEQYMLRAKMNFYTSPLGRNTLSNYRRQQTQYNQPPLNELRITKFINDQNFLESMPVYYRSEKYFFVHGGVDPDRELENQNINGFMFCRDALVKSDKKFSHLIIHSTNGSKPEIKGNRIGISAGCDSKTLSCVVLNDKRPDTKPEAFGKIIEDIFSVSLS
jgi:serine/threonine protein phosphatase 1